MATDVTPDITQKSYASAEGAKAYMDKEALHAAARNAACRRLLETVAVKGGTAVDVGCGFGRDVAVMRELGMRAWGVDASPVLLAEARRLYGGKDWVEADFLTLESLQDAPFDVVWSMAALVHVPRRLMPALLMRWWGWVKDGGSLVIATKEGEGEQVMDNLGRDHPRLMVYYTARAILDVLEPLGAQVVLREDGASGSALPTGDKLMRLVLRK